MDVCRNQDMISKQTSRECVEIEARESTLSLDERLLALSGSKEAVIRTHERSAVGLTEDEGKSHRQQTLWEQ